MNLIKGINQRSRWGFSGIKIREWQKNKRNCAIILRESVQTDKSRGCNLFLSYSSTIIFWNNTYWYKLVFVSTARWHRLWQAASESNKHTNYTFERGRPLQIHITRFSLLKLEKQTQFERWWWGGAIFIESWWNLDRPEGEFRLICPWTTSSPLLIINKMLRGWRRTWRAVKLSCSRVAFPHRRL